MVEFEKLAEETGLELRVVWQTMRVLDGEGFVDAYFASGFSGFVSGVSGQTRRELGSWPSPESLVDQLARAFTEAAEHEVEPEQKTKLRAVADGLTGAGRTVAVELFTAWLRRESHL